MALWYFTISNRPQEAKWISQAEKEYLVKTLHDEQLLIKGKTVRNASLRRVLGDRIMWQLILVNFFYQTGIYGYTLWLPTILKGLMGNGGGAIEAAHEKRLQLNHRPVTVGGASG